MNDDNLLRVIKAEIAHCKNCAQRIQEALEKLAPSSFLYAGCVINPSLRRISEDLEKIAFGLEAIVRKQEAGQ